MDQKSPLNVIYILKEKELLLQKLYLIFVNAIRELLWH